MTSQTFVEIWRRRAITIPGYFLAWALTAATLPLTALVAVVHDLARRSRWAMTRTLGFLVLYLSAETAAIALSFGMWLASGGFVGVGKKRLENWTYTLQRWWGGWLFHGAFWLFGMNLDVEGLDEIETGPLLLFFRHVAMPDTSLPGTLFMLRKPMRIRHIIKRELLWDPTLDIAGRRAPHFFVRRGAADSAAEIAGVRRLARNLADDEGVVIFPEGTRFTPRKRARVLEALAEKGDAYLLEKARSLKNVLPPRLGGCLALLEENVRASAVFCAHVGFEAATKAHDMLNGSLIGRTIRVKLWLEPFAGIPKSREAQIEWLYEKWARVDEWIEQHRQAETAAATSPA